jgi:hypothetical protein
LEKAQIPDAGKSSRNFFSCCRIQNWEVPVGGRRFSNFRHSLNQKTRMKTPLLLSLALFGSLSSAPAALLFGLTSSNQLVSFDSAAPGSVTNHGTISQSGIVDIDYYPANGKLYGITSGGSFYTINTATAVATLAGSPSASLGTVTDMDFNPQADRMRIFSVGANTNFRMVPDFTTNNPGTVGTVTTDGVFSDPAAVLVGSAYTNNFDGATSTVLYSINTTNDQLYTHSGAPQFNTIASVGALGISVGSNVGFDIDPAGIAYLSDDSNLYTVNLATGATSSLGAVGVSGLTSLAAFAVPEPSSAGIAAFCAGALIGRRKRQRA